MRTAKWVIAFLAIAAVASAQTPIPKPPPPPPGMVVPDNLIRDSVMVPQTYLEAVWTEMTGRVVWKRVHREFKLIGGGPRIVFWIENETHPGPTLKRVGIPDWLKYDPKPLSVTRTSVDFDAPAGDFIVYMVGSH